MTRLLLVVSVVALAGCPPPPHYAIIEVRSPEPVGDALVAAECGPYHGAATRTDDLGRARVAVSGRVVAGRCLVLVAKQGYSTVETDGVQLCNTATACPATVIELPQRTYAQPPAGAP